MVAIVISLGPAFLAVYFFHRQGVGASTLTSKKMLRDVHLGQQVSSGKDFRIPTEKYKKIADMNRGHFFWDTKQEVPVEESDDLTWRDKEAQSARNMLTETALSSSHSTESPYLPLISTCPSTYTSSLYTNALPKQRIESDIIAHFAYSVETPNKEEANVDQIVTTIEKNIHKMLSEKMLKCLDLEIGDQDSSEVGNQELRVIGVISAPIDAKSSWSKCFALRITNDDICEGFIHPYVHFIYLQRFISSLKNNSSLFSEI